MHQTSMLPAVTLDGETALIIDSEGNPTWRYDTGWFRERLTVAGLSLQELERRCGWSTSYASRVLGLREQSTSTRRNRAGEKVRYRYNHNPNKTITYGVALKLARALGLDPVEVGV